MRETLCVDVVDCLDELLGVVAHNALLEGARVGYIVKELTAWDKLAHDVGNLHKIAILLLPGCILVEFVVLDDVTVLKTLHRLDFILEQLEGSLVKLWVVQAEDLDGVLVAVGSSGELHFGAEARAERLSKSVLVNRGCHLF